MTSSYTQFSPADGDQGSRTVVVFGSSRAGKSSLVNLLTDNQYNIPVGGRGTFEAESYLVRDQDIVLVDTPGTGPAQPGGITNAENLETLIRLLRGLKGGIHLFVMVKQCSNNLHVVDRATYELIVEKLGQHKVPVVLVVTGCEAMEDMNAWTSTNKLCLEKAKLKFNAIVSGTCLAGGDPPQTDTTIQRRQQTKLAVWTAIEEHISSKPVKIASESESFFKDVAKSCVKHFPGGGVLLRRLSSSAK